MFKNDDWIYWSPKKTSHSAARTCAEVCDIAHGLVKIRLMKAPDSGQGRAIEVQTWVPVDELTPRETPSAMLGEGENVVVDGFELSVKRCKPYNNSRYPMGVNFAAIDGYTFSRIYPDFDSAIAAALVLLRSGKYRECIESLLMSMNESMHAPDKQQSLKSKAMILNLESRLSKIDNTYSNESLLAKVWPDAIFQA